MRKIGLIVAVEEEAMRQKYGEGYDLNDGYGTVLYQTAKSQVYALYSGAGEIFAAAATQYLIDRYEVAAVLNYGVVGGCREDLMADEPCLVDCVVHWQYDLSDVDGVPVGRYMEYQTGGSRPMNSSWRRQAECSRTCVMCAAPLAISSWARRRRSSGSTKSSARMCATWKQRRSC